MRICTIDGCNKKHEAKGFCKSHYNKFIKYGDPLAAPTRKKYSKRKSNYTYEDNHKYIDDIEHKLCSDCNEWHPMSEEYYYKNKSSKKDGFNPYCKECTKKRAYEWQEKNNDKMRGYFKKCDAKESRKKLKGEYSKKQKESGYYKQWQQDNPDKVSGYNKDRKMHKQHDITDQEWFACIDFFHNSCAYCGLSEEMQYKLYNEQFHKEHVDHNGSNYIDNCVPSCTGCNTSKHTSELRDWYNENNEMFSKRRLNKIIKWMTEECFKVLNLQ